MYFQDHFISEGFVALWEFVLSVINQTQLVLWMPQQAKLLLMNCLRSIIQTIVGKVKLLLHQVLLLNILAEANFIH
jgi:hypothetical protein